MKLTVKVTIIKVTELKVKRQKQSKHTKLGFKYLFSGSVKVKTVVNAFKIFFSKSCK